MSNSNNRQQDISIRTIGLVAVAIAMAAIWRMYGSVHTAPHHDGSMLELALAAIGVTGMCGGNALIALGHHIFDQVAVTRPWGHAASSKPIAETTLSAGPALPQRRTPAPFIWHCQTNVAVPDRG